LVSQLALPDGWRERLEELAEHQEECEETEGRRRYLEDRLRRLRELYLDGDFTKGEYNRRRAKLQAELSALTMPEPSAIESAGEALETLGEVRADAPKRLQSKILKTIFQKVVVDLAARQLASVKPWPPFWPLFRMGGLEEGKKGVFYV
jgi:hypothetical protein